MLPAPREILLLPHTADSLCSELPPTQDWRSKRSLQRQELPCTHQRPSGRGTWQHEPQLGLFQLPFLCCAETDASFSLRLRSPIVQCQREPLLFKKTSYLRLALCWDLVQLY